jgi:hypothetical protein
MYLIVCDPVGMWKNAISDAPEFVGCAPDPLDTILSEDESRDLHQVTSECVHHCVCVFGCGGFFVASKAVMLRIACCAACCVVMLMERALTATLFGCRARAPGKACVAMAWDVCIVGVALVSVFACVV